MPSGHGRPRANARFSRILRALTEVLGRDICANDPRMSAGYPSPKLPLWADFSFLKTWLFETWLFAISTRKCSLALFCVLVRTCVFLRSVALFLHPTAFRVTAFGNFSFKSQIQMANHRNIFGQPAFVT